MAREHEAAATALLGALDVDGQWSAAQVARALDHLATDAAYHVYAWETPHIGHEAIRAELMRQAALFSDLRTRVVSIASSGSTVFMERRDSMMIGGVQISPHVAAVFEIDAQGKVGVWRDYWDRKELEVALAGG